MPRGIRATLATAAAVTMLSVGSSQAAPSPTDHAALMAQIQAVLAQYHAAQGLLATLPTSAELSDAATPALQPLLAEHAAQQQTAALRLDILSNLGDGAPTASEIAALLAQAQADAVVAANIDPCIPGTSGCVPAPVPEPGTMALFAGALAALAWRRRSEG